MSNAASQKRPVSFQLIETRVVNPHNFQFYVDYGTTERGPWAKVGLNDTEFLLGFVPDAMIPRAQGSVHAVSNVN